MDAEQKQTLSLSLSAGTGSNKLTEGLIALVVIIS